MRRVGLLLRKDALVLRRSPLLLGILLAYPDLIAVLVGIVAGYANAKPRVALVDEDGLPRVVTIAGERFNVQRTIDRVSKDVTLVRLPRAEAARQLRSGKAVAVVTVPEGFIETLQAMVHSPKLRVQTARGVISSRVDEQVQALVYALNRQLQHAYIRTNLGYVKLILRGGRGKFAGRSIDVLGLERADRLLAQMPRGPRRDRLRDFVHDARLALAQTGNALRATAHPIETNELAGRGRDWAL
jgi:ABC-2 type transport system permease protein